jgi:uncharacterized integral membrane protein
VKRYRISKYLKKRVGIYFSILIICTIIIVLLCLFYATHTARKINHDALYHTLFMLILDSTTEIITRFLIIHRSCMFRVIRLKTDIDRYLLHRFPTAGWCFLVILYDSFFLTFITLVVVNRHKVPPFRTHRLYDI